MPFDADLRAGIFKLNFNMSWFYEALSDANMTIEFHTLTGGVEKYNEKAFEQYIEEYAERYIMLKVFKVDDDDIDDDCIWNYLTMKALAFEEKYPEWLTIHVDNGTEVSE